MNEVQPLSIYATMTEGGAVIKAKISDAICSEFGWAEVYAYADDKSRILIRFFKTQSAFGNRIYRIPNKNSGWVSAKHLLRVYTFEELRQMEIEPQFTKRNNIYTFKVKTV